MTIVLLVQAPWVVENLERVGGGCLFALTYNTSQFSPAAHAALSQNRFVAGTPVQIFWQEAPGAGLLVADGQLVEPVITGTTVRLDIRLLRVRPFVPRLRRPWPVAEVRVDIA